MTNEMNSKKNAPHITAEAKAKRATQEAKAAEAANFDKHPATLSTEPRPYLIAVYTADMVAANDADKAAAKARRKAETAARKASRAEHRAAIVGTEEAAEAAAKLRAAAELADTTASTAERQAELAHAKPTAFIHYFTINAAKVQEAHAAAEVAISEMVKAGELPPAGKVSAMPDPHTIEQTKAEETAAAIRLQYAKERYTTAADKAKAAEQVTAARHEYAAAAKAAESAAAFVLAAGAEQVAKRVAARMVEREGTPTQWNILHAAQSRRHFDNDLFEMIAAAREPMAAVIYGTERTAAALETLTATTAARLNSRDKYERESVTEGEKTEARAAKRVAAAIRARLADPTGNGWALDMYRAAFLAVNDHLAACRSIRTDEKPTPLSLDDMDVDTEDFAIEYSAEAAERSTTLRKAFNAAAAKMPPVRRRVFVLMGKGYAVTQIAHRMNRSHGLIQQHGNAIRADIAAELTENAPTLAATIRAAAIIQSITERTRAAHAERVAAIDAAYAAAISSSAAMDAVHAITKAHKAEKAAAETDQGRAALMEKVSQFPTVRLDVWHMMASGAGCREIARRMSRNPKTISEHMSAIRAALVEAAEAISEEYAATIQAADLVTLAALLK